MASMVMGGTANTPISQTEAALRTYSNYNRAWCLWPPQESPTAAQSRLSALNKVRRASEFDVDLVERHLLRGALTLKAINAVHVTQDSEFAIVSALWLPVQVYYAAHALGTAYLAAHMPENPLRTHTSFMGGISDVVRRLFPSPASAVLRDGYHGCQYMEPQWSNIEPDFSQIGSGTNLRHPTLETRGSHVAQCLSTTRERVVQKAMTKARTKKRKESGSPRARLLRREQVRVASRVRPTTVFEYLYRARLKSNYEDPAMYGLARSGPNLMLDFVSTTQNLAQLLCRLLVPLLERSLGRCGRQEIVLRIRELRLLAGRVS